MKCVKWLSIACALFSYQYCLAQIDSVSNSSSLETVIKTEKKRLLTNQEQQTEINHIADNNDELIKDYEAKLESVESLEVYNALLKQQIDNQLSEIANLQESIANATVIERRIIPLLQNMVSALELFVKLDVPFLKKERQQRLDKLNSLLARSDVSVAEKTRRVFEAYEIEIDYGGSIEKYTDKITLNGAQWDAEILRVGRISLSFITLGQNQSGYWNHQARQWQLRNDGTFRRFISQGLKVAGKETAPELMTVALSVNADFEGASDEQ